MAAGEPLTPHVAECGPCQARLDAITAWATATAAVAAETADAVFTPDRLARQREAVLARLEAAGRSARVIAFPAGTAGAPASGTARAVRWTVAAAVAGLAVGVASGHLLDWHPEAVRPSASASAPVSAPAVPLSRIVSAPDAIEAASLESLDEEGLLDAAYDRVSVDALQAIDDITPRAREFARSTPPRRFP